MCHEGNFNELFDYNCIALGPREWQTQYPNLMGPARHGVIGTVKHWVTRGHCDALVLRGHCVALSVTWAL